jgi:hypothetical protein
MINIRSSSAVIERFFSICGIIDAARRRNSKTDLFTTRALLKANYDILKKLNSTRKFTEND